MNELEQDKRYVFGDMIIVATTDFDFNPILKMKKLLNKIDMKQTV